MLLQLDGKLGCCSCCSCCSCCCCSSAISLGDGEGEGEGEGGGGYDEARSEDGAWFSMANGWLIFNLEAVSPGGRKTRLERWRGQKQGRTGQDRESPWRRAVWGGELLCMYLVITCTADRDLGTRVVLQNRHLFKIRDPRQCVPGSAHARRV